MASWFCYARFGLKFLTLSIFASSKSLIENIFKKKNSPPLRYKTWDSIQTNLYVLILRNVLLKLLGGCVTVKVSSRATSERLIKN